MDDVDLAQGEEAILQKVTLSQRRNVLPAIGHCYNCEEPLPAGRVFCDQACEEDYRKFTWQQRQQGRVNDTPGGTA